MLELDVIFMPFFEHEFDGLGEAEQRTFIRLLECEDPELFAGAWVTACPEDPDFAAMIP